MQLHKDKRNFRTILDYVAKKTELNETILEKDYYVTVFLRQLAELQNSGYKAYFKGGTALYKALKTVGRFSEDIDLTVNIEGLANWTQKRNYLKKVTKINIDCFNLLENECCTNKQNVLAVYAYDSFYERKTKDELDRFGKLKIEATSFTVSEPIEDLEVSCLIYNHAEEEQKRILRDSYAVVPFPVKTITMERLFIDKLFAAETYIRQLDKKGIDAAKHLYDLTVMYGRDNIRQFVHDENKMAEMISIRLKEEQARLGGISGVLPKDFIFFKQLEDNKTLAAEFEKMQRIYVLHDKYRVTIEDMIQIILKIYEELCKNPAWNETINDKKI